LLGQLTGIFGIKGARQEGADIRRPSIEVRDQSRRIVTISGQRRFEIVDGAGQDLLDDFGGNRLGAEAKALLECEGEMHLDLKRRAQTFGDEVDGFFLEEFANLYAFGRTGAEPIPS
jgi:hypothetical protein